MCLWMLWGCLAGLTAPLQPDAPTAEIRGLWISFLLWLMGAYILPLVKEKAPLRPGGKFLSVSWAGGIFTGPTSEFYI